MSAQGTKAPLLPVATPQAPPVSGEGAVAPMPELPLPAKTKAPALSPQQRETQAQAQAQVDAQAQVKAWTQQLASREEYQDQELGGQAAEVNPAFYGR